MRMTSTYLRAARPGPEPDAALLRAFVATRSEAAFAELVRRHGPMVLGVCRRGLRDPHDGDDAFQAAWLILARKARTIAHPDRLPGWLHAVAVRAAAAVRRARDRRLAAERPLDPDLDPPAPETLDRPDADAVAALDDEVARLPDRLRQAVVLCELEGRSRKDAAARLGVPEGTLSSRLATARKRLADRLARRGVTAGVGAGVTVPPTLLADTVRAAAGEALPAGSAARIAEVVMNGMLAGKLKVGGVVAVLAAGLVAVAPGVGRPSPAGGDPPANAAAAKPDPAELVKQLADPDFARREAAEKQLQDLGPAARAAVAAGSRSTDAEVARRAGRLLARLQAADRVALAAWLRDGAEANQPLDHPLWKRFAAVTGDTPAARRLFAAVVRDPDRLARLTEAEDRPDAAARPYARQLADREPRTAATAAALLLGTHAATAEHKHQYADWSALQTGVVEVLSNDHAGPGRKLVAAWVAGRTEPGAVADGFELARACGLRECLPHARAVAADPKRPPRNRADALLAVGQFGTPADAALARPLLADTARYNAGLIGKPCRAEVRDVAAAAMLLVHGQKPHDYGFVCGLPEPKVGPKSDRYVNVYGFESDAGRAAGHRAAREYVAAAAAPARPAAPAAGAAGDLDTFLAEFKADTSGAKDFAHPLWKRWVAVAGTDAAARALFGLIVADKPRAERLAAAVAVPATAGKLYAAEVAAARAYHREFCDAFLARVEDERDDVKRWARTQEVIAEQAAADPPAARVGALLFLGTFPASADVSLGDNPNRVHIDAVPVALGALPRPVTAGSKAGRASPSDPACRRLFAAWLSARAVDDDRADGLKAAASAGATEVLPLARRWAADPLRSPKVRGLCLPIVACHGGPADRPLAAALHDNAAYLGSVTVSAPGQPGDGKTYTQTVGDLALAADVLLAGGSPRELGFVGGWSGRPETPGGTVGEVAEARFADEEARQAAYRKARAWLAGR